MSTSPEPVFSVTGDNLIPVIPDLIVKSDDRFNALDAPLATELACCALNVQPVEVSHYCYEEVWLSIQQIACATFRLRHIQWDHIRSLVSSICALSFDYHNGTITVTWTVECNSTDSARRDAIAEQDDQKVVIDGFRMILLNGTHRSSSAR